MLQFFKKSGKCLKLNKHIYFLWKSFLGRKRDVVESSSPTTAAAAAKITINPKTTTATTKSDVDDILSAAEKYCIENDQKECGKWKLFMFLHDVYA